MEPLLVVVSGLGVSAVAWTWTGVRRWGRGLPLIARTPRQPVPWGIVDVVAVLAAWMFIQTLLAAAVGAWRGLDFQQDLVAMSPEGRVWAMGVTSVARVLAVFVSVLFTVSTARANAADLGWHGRSGLRDCGLGLVAFMLVGPMVIGIQFLLATWFQPTQHPLVKLLMDNPDPALVVLAVVGAAGVAPVVEEYFFRVMLQGWLEKNLEPKTGPLAIVVSAACFAAVHLSHGPDPIPLFVFALALGYLYRQTHRLLPCVVLHFLLNAYSLTALLAAKA